MFNSASRDIPLSLGEAASKLRSFGETAEEKQVLKAARPHPSVPSSSIASQLEQLRSQIDFRLEALVIEFAKDNALPQSFENQVALQSAPTEGRAGQPTSLNPLLMPTPDIAISPPPVEASRLAGRRVLTPNAARSPSKVAAEPISGPISSWRASFQEATGLGSCCVTKSAESKQHLVIVQPQITA